MKGSHCTKHRCGGASAATEVSRLRVAPLRGISVCGCPDDRQCRTAAVGVVLLHVLGAISQGQGLELVARGSIGDKESRESLPHLVHEEPKLRGSTGQVSRKRIPLPSLPRIGRERGTETVRHRCRDRRVAPSKRCDDGSSQSLRIDFESARQLPHVVVVLNAAVGHVQDDHRMKLLGDHGLGRIRTQVRRRHVEQHRQIDVLDTRLDNIAPFSTKRSLCGDRLSRRSRRSSA